MTARCHEDENPGHRVVRIGGRVRLTFGECHIEDIDQLIGSDFPVGSADLIEGVLQSCHLALADWLYSHIFLIGAQKRTNKRRLELNQETNLIESSFPQHALQENGVLLSQKLITNQNQQPF